MPSARTAVLTVLAGVLTASGCGLLPGSGGGGSTPSTAASARPGDLTGGRHYRAGWFGKTENRAAFDVHRVERYGSYSVLYMDVYTGASATAFQGWFGQNANSSDFGQFALLDPVGKKYYSSLREDDADGPAFGTRIDDWKHPGITPGIDAQPGVRYPVEVYFPPVPAGVRTITVLAPGTLGEMTGIPVLNPRKAQAPVPAASDNDSEAPKPKRGQAFFYPVTAPKGRIWSQTQDLHDYSEGLEKTTSTGGGEQKIALRTDVLFAFDKANLSPKATAVLDDAINQTRAQADPSKPPITITGFTDAKGSDSYNQKLSVRRARAVQKYISAKLGNTYRYQANGKGEADPVAANTHQDGSDNPAGRAKNRRVEIGYKIKQQKPTVTTTQSATPQPGAVGAPGPFRTSDGQVVGSVRRSGSNLSSSGARLDVYPFHRDGAYLVGVFNVHDEGGNLQELSLGLDDQDTKAVSGATLGGVTVTDNISKTREYVTRRGGFNSTEFHLTSYVEGTLGVLDQGEDNRMYAYYPAPPAGVTKVDVKAADWGTVRNVPIQ